MTADPMVFLLKTLGNLYLFVVLLRLVLQLSRADFYNPITQGIVKATNPLLLPLRKIIPSLGRVDMASIVLAFGVQLLTIILVLALSSYQVSPLQYAVFTVAGTVYHLLDLYFWAMLISVILSWVAPGANHPGAMLVQQVTAPLYDFCRKFIPNLGGLDISPIFIFILLTMLKQVFAPYVI